MFRLAHDAIHQMFFCFFFGHCHRPPLLILRPPMAVQGQLNSYQAMLSNRIICVHVWKQSGACYTGELIKSKAK